LFLLLILVGLLRSFFVDFTREFLYRVKES
jgi:hypothetical protein